jgi:TrmH family RNA methyltransferase
MTLLSTARDLRRRKARERRSMFVVEGVRAAEELLRSPLEIHAALVAPQLDDAPRGAALYAALHARGIPVEEIAAREFASAAETESPQGVLVMARVPERTLEDIPRADGIVLVLDAVQDPGNVGTILRTAHALGALATIALSGTVDLWNAKVIRSAMGAHFTHLAMDATWDELTAFLERTQMELWAAAADGQSVRDVTRPWRVALALGNEGAGVSQGVAASARRRVGIPLAGGAESLNVAVAAGILLYTMSRSIT